jgi:hypothetical protein
MELLIAFITGLTTGGLSCLAVQGGLLAQSIAYEAELSVGQQLAQSKKQRRNQPLKLALVTKNTYSCSRAFIIPDLNFQKLLPATGTEVIDLPPQPAGAVLYYTCSMGMYTGQIEFK